MTMSEYLFEDFLNSEREYRDAEMFWREIWDDAQKHARSDWIQPWFSTQSRELEDGNPIFSAWSPSERRGLRIVQILPDHIERDVNYWIDWFGGDAWDLDAVTELVIVCAPTSANRQRIVLMLERWVAQGDVSEQINTLETTGITTSSLPYVEELVGLGAL
jgi:hypothetical protein